MSTFKELIVAMVIYTVLVVVGWVFALAGCLLLLKQCGVL